MLPLCIVKLVERHSQIIYVYLSTGNFVFSLHVGYLNEAEEY